MRELNTSKKTGNIPPSNGTVTPSQSTDDIDREGNILTKTALTIAELGITLLFSSKYSLSDAALRVIPFSR
jgi:hypothetical protein